MRWKLSLTKDGAHRGHRQGSADRARYATMLVYILPDAKISQADLQTLLATLTDVQLHHCGQ
jgi:hypothetical protein